MTEHVEQPTPTHQPGVPSVQSAVRQDLEARERLGITRYGTRLQPHNGRNALRDLYEELLDACCYLKQELIERESASFDTLTDRLAEVTRIAPGKPPTSVVGS